ncbi:hypothetical protein ACNS7O_00090 [Haloferacaceae archaeon DSL9]
MSTPTPNAASNASTAQRADSRWQALLSKRRLVRPVRFVSFWLAILLPLCYLRLLSTGGDPLTFLGLLGANALALVVGHNHNRSD